MKNEKKEIKKINKNKGERGSITVLVLASLLFFLMFFMSLYAKNSNKLSSQEKEIKEVEKAYNEDIELAYNRKKYNNNEVIDPSTVLKGGIPFSRANGKIDIQFLEGVSYNPIPSGNIIKANKPKIDKNNMIPLNWNGNNWVITDEENWKYSYDENKKEWANVMLTDGTYKIGTKVGTVVDDYQLGSMLVWIPRYAYKITYYDEKDINKTGKPIGYSDARGLVDGLGRTPEGMKQPATSRKIGEYYRPHPAFENGVKTGFTQGEWDKNLSGIWMGKFETTKTNNKIDIKPDTNIYTQMSISDFYSEARNLNVANSHMTKNSEWGAMSYLAYSKYGRNGVKVQKNENFYKITGGGNYKANVNQSTTGNIYGIYDTNGGCWEYTAAYIPDSSTTYGYKFASKDPNNTNAKNDKTESTKFSTTYEYNFQNKTLQKNYTENINRKFGDAIVETSNEGTGITSWNSEDSVFAGKINNNYYPFFTRSGVFTYTTGGIFYFDHATGQADPGGGFRMVCVVD